MPVEKKEGDVVIGATLNKSGSFKSEAQKVGKAIVREAERKGLSLLDPQNFKAIEGYGVEAKIMNKDILIGSFDFMEDRKVEL